MLAYNLDFRMISLVTAGALLTASFSTLSMAVAGFGVWALVLGNLIGTGARSLGFVLLSCKRYRASWRIDRALPTMRFGGTIVAQRVVWWFYSHIDILLLGRLYQADAVGVYSVARELAALPHHKLGAALNQVTLASFACVQRDAVRVRSYLLQAIKMLAFVAVPVFAAISALAPEAIPVLLGEKWIAAVDPVRILVLIVPLRMISAAIGEVLNARGHPLFMLGNMLILLAVAGPAIAIGSVWGVLGVCIAWAWPLVSRRARRRSCAADMLARSGNGAPIAHLAASPCSVMNHTT